MPTVNICIVFKQVKFLLHNRGSDLRSIVQQVGGGVLINIYRDRAPFRQGTDGQNPRAAQEALPESQRGGEREKSTAFASAVQVRDPFSREFWENNH